jgi:hypothetical protein
MTSFAAVRTSAVMHRNPYRQRFPRLRTGRLIARVVRWVLRVPRTRPSRIIVRAPIRRRASSSSGGSEPHLARRAV